MTLSQLACKLNQYNLRIPSDKPFSPFNVVYLKRAVLNQGKAAPISLESYTRESEYFLYHNDDLIPDQIFARKILTGMGVPLYG